MRAVLFQSILDQQRAKRSQKPREFESLRCVCAPRQIVIDVLGNIIKRRRRGIRAFAPMISTHCLPKLNEIRNNNYGPGDVRSPHSRSRAHHSFSYLHAFFSGCYRKHKCFTAAAIESLMPLRITQQCSCSLFSSDAGGLVIPDRNGE